MGFVTFKHRFMPLRSQIRSDVTDLVMSLLAFGCIEHEEEREARQLGGRRAELPKRLVLGSG